MSCIFFFLILFQKPASMHFPQNMANRNLKKKHDIFVIVVEKNTLVFKKNQHEKMQLILLDNIDKSIDIKRRLYKMHDEIITIIGMNL